MFKAIKKHYHWLVAFLVFLEMIIYGGLINSASVFVQPVSLGLGVSTTSYSVAMMPYTVSCFLGTCMSGFLFSRFGYKKTAMVSLMVIALSLVLTACSTSIYMFCFSKILFGTGYGACFTAGSVRIVKDWFHKHQGLVLGAVSMSTGLGGSLMTMVLSRIIAANGWRVANLVAAVMITVIAALYLLLKDRPEQMNLRPFGFGQAVQSKKTRTNGDDWPGFGMSRQWKSPLFYLMCLCVVGSCVCLYTTSGFVVPHFRSQGYSADQAAMYQSVYMLTLAGVKLLLGFLFDRFGPKPLLIGCMLCGAAGQLILGYTNDPVLCMIAMLLFAVGLCMSSIMIPLIAAPLFGYKACLSVNGIFLGLSTFSSMFSSPISSMCYDRTGSYMPVYRVTSLVLIGVLAVYLLLFTLAKKEKKRYYELHPNK